MTKSMKINMKRRLETSNDDDDNNNSSASASSSANVMTTTKTTTSTDTTKIAVQDEEDNEEEEDSILKEQVCWKCQGYGKKRVKNLPRKKQHKQQNENDKNDDKQQQQQQQPFSHCYVGATCPVCQGTGKRMETSRSQRLAVQPGIIQKLRGRNGVWSGVPAVGKLHDNDNDNNSNNNTNNNNDSSPPLVKQGEIMAALGCGDWRIFQLANGHKLTVDDFICAWVAAEEMRKRGYGAVLEGEFGQVLDGDNDNNDEKKKIKSFRHADIGCGCGSVLMTLLWAFPGSIQSHGVEAQQVSYDLCRRGLAWNLGIDVTEEKQQQEEEKEEQSTTPVVQLTHHDLRTWNGGSLVPYDLVTGTPPYFPKDRFVASENHAQKVRCRIPTRGAASDYIEAATKLVKKKDGLICVVETARIEGERAVLETIDKCSLKIIRRLDVITRTGLPPRFSCWVLTPCCDSESGESYSYSYLPTKEENDNDKNGGENGNKETSLPSPSSFPIEYLTIRNADQTRTLEYVDAMEKMGWVDFEQTREKEKEKKANDQK